MSRNKKAPALRVQVIENKNHETLEATWRLYAAAKRGQLRGVTWVAFYESEEDGRETEIGATGEARRNPSLAIKWLARLAGKLIP